MTGKKNLIAYIIFFALAACSSEKREEVKTEKTVDAPTVKTDNGWELYTDTVNAGFIMSFEYPAHMLPQSIQNARCVGEKAANPENNTDAMQWCIWMQDTVEFSVNDLVKEQKLLFKGKVNQQSDTVMIDYNPALRVILKGAAGTSIQIVYLKTFGTLFEIICKGENDKDFERFYKSLKIVKNNSK